MLDQPRRLARAAAAHRVRLARARLAVREDRHVEAGLEPGQKPVANALREESLARGVRPKDMVVRERLSTVERHARALCVERPRDEGDTDLGVSRQRRGRHSGRARRVARRVVRRLRQGVAAFLSLQHVSGSRLESGRRPANIRTERGGHVVLVYFAKSHVAAAHPFLAEPLT
eukprot:7381927-Prymnesium_polylepis.3